MRSLHIANTDFEHELAYGTRTSNAIFLQLQFLPLLYAKKDDGIGVSHLPYPSIAQCHLLDEKEFPYDQVDSWGASLTIAKWAHKHKIRYTMPPWEVVKQVNSKAFSFERGLKLPGATLLHTWNDVKNWKGPGVLKTCFGVSGKGHLFVPCDENHLRKFVEREFSLGLPLVAEPWVERIYDFSTQWMISETQEIIYIGPTLCLTDSRGHHRGNQVGNITLPHLEEHKAFVMPVLKEMSQLGYFGHVGIDAMVWGTHQLQPIVEINARKTMGWVALQLLHSEKQTITLSFVAKSERGNQLPDGIIQKDQTVFHFSRKVVVD